MRTSDLWHGAWAWNRNGIVAAVTVGWLMTVALPIGWAGATEITDAMVSGGKLQFTFDAETNGVYAVERSADLHTDWVTIQQQAGGAPRIRVEVPISESLGFFRIRRIPLLPLAVDAVPVTLKAGEASMVSLQATGAHGELRWSSAEGALPEGVRLLSDGRLDGVPTAAAAELNENGRYLVSVTVAEMNADGGIEREATGEIPMLVRLSYQLNLRAKREHGPSFQEGCAVCHGSGFHPDFAAPLATGLVNVAAGSGGACGPSSVYVRPGEVSGSLLYGKLSASPPCGERMPQGGPFFSDRALERLARWIRELTPADAD